MSSPERQSLGSFVLGTIIGVLLGVLLTGRSGLVETCMTVIFIMALVGATIG